MIKTTFTKYSGDKSTLIVKKIRLIH